MLRISVRNFVYTSLYHPHWVHHIQQPGSPDYVSMILFHQGDLNDKAVVLVLRIQKSGRDIISTGVYFDSDGKQFQYY
jgi:hypothetical protein